MMKWVSTIMNRLFDRGFVAILPASVLLLERSLITNQVFHVFCSRCLSFFSAIKINFRVRG